MSVFSDWEFIGRWILLQHVSRNSKALPFCYWEMYHFFDSYHLLMCILFWETVPLLLFQFHFLYVCSATTTWHGSVDAVKQLLFIEDLLKVSSRWPSWGDCKLPMILKGISLHFRDLYHFASQHLILRGTIILKSWICIFVASFVTYV